VKQRKLIVAGALFAAGALALSACGGGSDDDASGGDTDSSTSAAITVYNTKPEKGLIPASTVESGGHKVIEAMFRGLVHYNADTAAPELAMAESIESTDNTVWTIKLKAGNTFHDGTPVTSDSFVKAWNWAAYGPNVQDANYFFAPFKGYAEMNPADPDGDGDKKAPTPKAKELSGLKVDSDTQFTVTLSSPMSVFPVMVGYTAFAPLPESFYADPEAFGKKPVGNGPLKFVSGDGDAGFALERWDAYKGVDKPKVAKVTYKSYTSDTAAYSDLQAGNLDFMDQVPASALVDNQFEKDLPGRSVNKPVGIIQTASLPLYDDNYKDPNVAKALSLAIDRPTITKSVYNGGRTPATGWVSPIVDGYKAGACGEFCTYDPVKAKEYLAKSSFKGPFTFATNYDGPGNKEMAEAICNSIKNALGVGCEPKAYVDFATFLTDRSAHKMKGLFRTGWNMDYPSIQNFLEPLYATGASSNDAVYTNKEFDALITKANGEEGDAALATFQQAEALLAKDMSVIPLWYQAQQSGWSERLSNVKVTPLSLLDVTSVTAK
jgi:oligopeptide transport system substrate-binding protein